MPQHSRFLPLAALLAAGAALALSGCGGSSPGTPLTGPNSGPSVSGNLGGSPGAVGASIAIPAQTLPVVDSQGRATGRTVTTPATAVAPGKPFALPISISDSGGITAVGIRFASEGGTVTCTDMVAGDAFPSQQVMVAKNVSAKSGAIGILSPVAAVKRSRAVLVTLTLVANSPNPTLVITGELAGSHAENLGQINPQASPAQVHVMAAKSVGDPLGQGGPTIQNANRILLAAVGTMPAPPGDEPYYDANGDGTINVRDANKVLLLSVGLGTWPIVLYPAVNVTGIVKDSLSNAPVSGVSVTVAGGAAATTDSNGSFTTTNQVGGGPAAVVVTGSAYLGFSADMTVATDSNPSTIGTLTIAPNTVSGTLYMPDGVTTDGGVSIECSTDSLHTVVSTTGATGQFTFHRIPSGNQVIIVRDQPNPADPTSPLTAYKSITIPAGGSVTDVSVVLSSGPPGPPV
jgi:hypothetical protein